MAQLTAAQALLNLIDATRRAGSTTVLLESPKVASGEALFVAGNQSELDQVLQDCPNLRGTTLDRLNAAVHPLVAQDRAAFLHAHANAEIVLLDVPLLYETGLDRTCDAVAVVSAPPEAQRQRVLARGMTEAEFDMLLCRQLSDAEKRRRATYIIPTTSLEAARQAVKDVLADIRRTLYA